MNELVIEQVLHLIYQAFTIIGFALFFLGFSHYLGRPVPSWIEGRLWVADLLIFIGFTADMISYLLRGNYRVAGIDLFISVMYALIFIYDWKNRRRRRKSLLALLGAKTRALRDKMLSRMPAPRSLEPV